MATAGMYSGAGVTGFTHRLCVGRGRKRGTKDDTKNSGADQLEGRMMLFIEFPKVLVIIII